MNEDPTGGGGEALKQALQWRGVAEQDADLLTQYRHTVLALAYVNVARHLSTDASLERRVKTDARELAKELELEVQAVTKQVAAR